MINALTSALTKMVVDSGALSGDDVPIIAFGIKTTILKSIHIITSIFIGLLFGKAVEVLFFHAFYITLRQYAGGYYAKTSIICFVDSCVMIVLCLLFWSYVPVEFYGYIIVGFSVLSAVMVFALSPIANVNKPLDEVERRVYRKKNTGYSCTGVDGDFWCVYFGL